MLLATSDAGGHWQAQMVQTASKIPQAFMDVYFLDRQRGWAVGAGGRVIATDDGGNHWRVQREQSTDHPVEVLMSVHLPILRMAWQSVQKGKS